jgi:hypothetical protein
VQIFQKDGNSVTQIVRLLIYIEQLMQKEKKMYFTVDANIKLAKLLIQLYLLQLFGLLLFPYEESSDVTRAGDDKHICHAHKQISLYLSYNHFKWYN